MAIDIGVTAIAVKDPTPGPGTAAGVLSLFLSEGIQVPARRQSA
jgi:hypothetical protein